MTRVFGRIRHGFSRAVWVFELRASGITVRRLGHRGSYSVPLDRLAGEAAFKIADAARTKRLLLNSEMRKRRRAEKAKNQMVMPV